MAINRVLPLIDRLKKLKDETDLDERFSSGVQNIRNNVQTGIQRAGTNTYNTLKRANDSSFVKNFNTSTNRLFDNLGDITGANKGVPSLINLAAKTNPIARRQVNTNPILKQRLQKSTGYGTTSNTQDVLNAAKFGTSFVGAPKVGLSLLSKGGLMGLGSTLGLGGTINKVTGGSFTEGVVDTARNLPSLYGVTGLTGPVINKAVGSLSSKVNNPLARGVVNRLSTGALNVPEGMAVNQALGQGGYTPTDLAVDFGSGVLLGSNAPQGMAKGLASNDLKLDSLLKQQKMLESKRVSMLDNGIKPKSPAYKAVDRELNKILVEINRLKRQGSISMGIVGDKKAQLKPSKEFIGRELNPPPFLNDKPRAEINRELLPQVQIDENLEMSRDALQYGDEVLKQLPDSVNKGFRNWVNTRRATNVDAGINKKAFESFDKEGLQGIFDVQSGTNNGKYANISKYFDDKYQQLQENGIDSKYLNNYIPQLWKETDAQVQEAIGKRLSLRPGFTKQRIIENYKAGIEAGLTPRYNKISDLVGWYDAQANKALADKAYFDNLIESGYIRPANNAPSGWVEITNFPRFSSKMAEGGKYSGLYSAPEPLARIINNYMRPSDPTLESVAKFTGRAKQMTLTGGVPNTAINAHGFNILARNTLARNNPISGFFTGAMYMVNPNQAQKYLDTNTAKLSKWANAGLTVSTEDSDFLKVFKYSDNPIIKKGQQGYELQERLLSEPLFNKMIPALKIQHAEEVYKDLVKSMPEDEALRIAAQSTNNIFGGINNDELAMSKSFQNILRIVFLAPDWARTNIALFKNIGRGVKNIRDPQFKAYRTFARNFIGAYTTFAITNKLLSGVWPWDNEPGQEFSLNTGSYTDEGKARYVRVFGTAADFLRLPYEAVSSTLKGDPVGGVVRPIANRLSTPLGSAIRLGTNRDYLGRPITGKDQWGNPIPVQQQVGGVVNEAANIVGFPNYLRAGVDFATGKSTAEQAIVNAIELPIRYKGGAFTDKQKEGVEMLQTEGKTGKQINFLLKNTKSVNLSESEKEEGELNSFEKGLIKTQLIEEKLPYKQVGSRYYYLDNGSLKNVDIESEITEPKYSGNAEVDKKLASDYKSAITKKRNDVAKLYELGVIDAQGAEELLALLDDKYSSSGRAKKIKLGATPTLKTPKIQRKASSSIKLNTSSRGIKLPNLKLNTSPVAQGIIFGNNRSNNLKNRIARLQKVTS